MGGPCLVRKSLLQCCAVNKDVTRGTGSGRRKQNPDARDIFNVDFTSVGL